MPLIDFPHRKIKFNPPGSRDEQFAFPDSKSEDNTITPVFESQKGMWGKT